MKIYMKEKYDARRIEAIEYLGGKCVDCGLTEMLEFDHINPEEKSFNISGKINSAPWHVILSELDKCVLRCIACHAHMTAFQRMGTFNIMRL